MKKLAMISILATLSTSAFALKVGYVNSQELFQKYSQTKVITEDLTKEKQKIETDLQKKEVELQKLQVELQNKTVTDAEKKDFETKVAAFQKLVRDSQIKLSTEESKKMQEIERTINISIQNVAKTGKYDYVLEQGALKYGGENITPQVLKVMESTKKVENKK